MKFSRKAGNEPLNKRLHFGGDADQRLDTVTVFLIRRYWEVWKVVSTDCAARRRIAGHALAAIAIATIYIFIIIMCIKYHDRRGMCQRCDCENTCTT